MYRLKASRHALQISQVSFPGNFRVPGMIPSGDGWCRCLFRTQLPNMFAGNFIYSKGSWSFPDARLVIHGRRYTLGAPVAAAVGVCFAAALPQLCPGTGLSLLPGWRSAICYFHRCCESPSRDCYSQGQHWAVFLGLKNVSITTRMCYCPSHIFPTKHVQPVPTGQILFQIGDDHIPSLKFVSSTYQKMLTNRHNICPGEQRKLLFFFLAASIHAGVGRLFISAVGGKG